MNTFSKNTKALFALFLSCLLVVGCEDDTPPVVEEDPATITLIDPTEGPVGTQVEIIGTNFGTDADVEAVDFNGTAATVTSVTDESILVTVPEGATTGPVTIVVRGEEIEGPDFTVTEEGAEPVEAVITEINPVEGYVGAEVIITGTGFGEELTDQVVMFNGVEAPISALTDEEIIVLVPEGATTGPVTFTMGDMTVEGPEFTVLEDETEPGVTSMSPTAGPVGSTVTIFGAGFGQDVANVAVSFNGTDAEITSVTDKEIITVVPDAATSGMVTVTVGDATYEAGEFTVTSGETGIYYGTGFDGDAEELIDTLGQAFLYEGGGLNGETVLRLTPAKSDRTGAAYYGAKVDVEGGFETTFDFRISRPGKPEGVEGETGADGLAFIIQGEGPDALGSRGADMGYGGITDAVVIEFDTYMNAADEDPNGNHISVQASVGGPGTPVHADPNYRLAQTTNATHPDLPQFIGNEMSSHTARVVYTPATEFEPGLLQIWVDGMVAPLEVAIDLSDYIALEEGKAFVGFTASTNHVYGWEAHDILNWSFTPLGE
ncbi:IPT/TIG domain-containing protein [Nafulsella turpanensis]|uniref:IPT/TIG domain-containing protein n=1 Tax=Nafulsella turpanensis TaxID=1265690 RepID=UPI00034D7DC1|nr:IPT/TIG domain-containing protein [Nafulsella turpanensis]